MLGDIMSHAYTQSSVSGTESISSIITKPLIINLAATGMYPTREQSPHVPITVEEIVKDVCSGIDLGVAMVHLHARGPDGLPAYDRHFYSEIISGIREHHPDTVIVVTTSGRRISELGKRASALHIENPLKPDMASLTLGSLNFFRETSMNSPEIILKLAEIMKARGIRPEMEVFDIGMVNFAKYLIAKEVIEPPFYFNILLGNVATAQLNILHLAAIINELPPGSFWSLGGLGIFQAQANYLGIILGHGVRTGLEDNIWLDGEKKQLATNADLVCRCVRMASAIQRPLATASQVREWLGLEQRP
jgi:3-keto-5-aminohexanoate cleavage enzyme